MLLGTIWCGLFVLPDEIRGRVRDALAARWGWLDVALDVALEDEDSRRL